MMYFKNSPKLQNCAWITTICQQIRSPKSVFALGGCDIMPEFKKTKQKNPERLSDSVSGKLPHGALKIHEEFKDTERIQRG